MAMITVIIVVHPSFIPTEESPYGTTDQHLTAALFDYAPHMVEEVFQDIDIPYLQDLVVEREDVEVHHRAEELYGKGDFWVIFLVDMDPPPSPVPTTQLRMRLNSALLRWFRSKEVGDVRLATDVEWRSEHKA